VPYTSGKVSANEADWIRVSGGSSLDNKPRWSPDGNLLYFTSDLDQHSCIWARRVDRGTKQPRGEAFPVLHLHGAQRSLSKSGSLSLEFSVAKDKLVFHLEEARGNIWMTKLSDR
jgi:hypothetical protein